ncbi:MAG: hypothetical protein E6772_07660 [Dysgonomonas sp.]|nr:hypothetical protein [Dysgonomonas sp.]
MREKNILDWIIMSLDNLLSKGEYVRYDRLCKVLIDGDRVLSRLEGNYPEYFDFGGLTRKESELLELVILEASAVNKGGQYPAEANGLKYLMDSCIMGSRFLEEYKIKYREEAVA